MGIDFLFSVDPAQADYPIGAGQYISSIGGNSGFPFFMGAIPYKLLRRLLLWA